MIRNQWQRRLLSCFLAFAVLLGCVLSCLPVRAGAIVPLGLVQSALASYVTSTGYKLYSDNGTGDDILGLLSDLYDEFRTSPSGVALGALTLANMASIESVFADNSGNIVVQKSAADIFQGFADYIKRVYAVPIGQERPTTVVAGGVGDFTDGHGVVARRFTYDTLNQSSPAIYYEAGNPSGTYTTGGVDYLVYFGSPNSQNYPLYVTKYNDRLFIRSPSASTFVGIYYFRSYSSGATNSFNVGVGTLTSADRWESSFSSGLNTLFANVPYSTVDPTSSESISAPLTGNFTNNLAVSLAQDVVNRAHGLADDESLVIAVGAGVGATAEDIAGIVAQGVKAQTLDPSVTVVADAVIDTPVQPYPDIDGLGLPTLGAALVSRFPFCVPWDFVDTLRILNAAPIPPVFDVTLVPASVAARWGVSGNYTLHVDLTSPEYAKLFVALRWGTLVGFCLGLALLTKRLIWTA